MTVGTRSCLFAIGALTKATARPRTAVGRLLPRRRRTDGATRDPERMARHRVGQGRQMRGRCVWLQGFRRHATISRSTQPSRAACAAAGTTGLWPNPRARAARPKGPTEKGRPNARRYAAGRRAHVADAASVARGQGGRGARSEHRPQCAVGRAVAWSAWAKALAERARVRDRGTGRSRSRG